MADLPYSAPPGASFAHKQGAKAAPVANVATMANWAAATVSLALIAGVGVWGYRLLVRDVTGIPVVEASGGPMRVAPEDPGGALADHQGLAVNAVAGQGTAAPPPERVVLATRPVTLTDEDLPMGAISAPAPVQPREAVRQTVALSDDAPASLGAPEPAAPQPQAAPDIAALPGSVEALADMIASGATPLGEVAEQSGTGSPLVARTEPEALAADPLPVQEGAAVVRSLRPQTRPSGLRTATIAPLAPQTEAPAVAEADPDSLPPGTRLVQLGAFDSPETARSEWDRLNARFGAFLEGKTRVIQRATSGGRTFYRLRAHGFADLSDTRRFCAELQAGRAECIPVSTR